MGLRTEIIRYNIHDRGRKYTGTPRQYHHEKLLRVINGDEVQEMVAKRDMYGYLGHDIRREFGLYPPEAAISGGKLIPLEPAFVTVHLKMLDDGTIEHQEQFLDTPLGIKAQEWYEKKMGGFSSVIAPSEENPTMCYGHDYVLAPNNAHNRGFVMDSTKDYNRLTSKQKLAVEQARRMEQAAVMDALIQTAQAIPVMHKQHNQLLATIESLSVQLDTVQRERDEFQAACDSLQPSFQPIARLCVNNGNWLAQSMSVMDDIRGIVIKEENPQERHENTINYNIFDLMKGR